YLSPPRVLPRKGRGPVPDFPRPEGRVSVCPRRGGERQGRGGWLMNQDSREGCVGRAAAGVRPWVALLIGLALGTVAGAGYAGLVVGSRWVVGARGHRLFAFATSSTVIGAVAGLVGGACVAFGDTAKRQPPR